MPYPIPKDELDNIGAALAQYYESAWTEGVKGLMDNMAHSKMGVLPHYLDQARDTFANLRKSSSDSFLVTFKPALKQHVSLYFANKFIVADLLVTVAEKALKAASGFIPLPATLLGEIIAFPIDWATEGGATHAKEVLHERAMGEADRQLVKSAGTPVQKRFTGDDEAKEFIAESINQYLLICKFIKTLPPTISTFDDAVTFPSAAFKVQAAASSLNVALLSVRQYLDGMQERLTKIQQVSRRYIETARKGMPQAVESILNQGYADAFSKGELDVRTNKFSALSAPQKPRPERVGGATLLARYLAHAVALGYYDSGNRGPQIGQISAASFRGPASFVKK